MNGGRLQSVSWRWVMLCVAAALSACGGGGDGGGGGGIGSGGSSSSTGRTEAYYVDLLDQGLVHLNGCYVYQMRSHCDSFDRIRNSLWSWCAGGDDLACEAYDIAADGEIRFAAANSRPR